MPTPKPTLQAAALIASAAAAASEKISVAAAAAITKIADAAGAAAQATERERTHTGVLAERMTDIARRTADIEDTLKEVAKAMTAFVRLETQVTLYLGNEASRDAETGRQDNRIQALEAHIIPMLAAREAGGKTKEWYVVAFLGFLGLLLAQVGGTWVTGKIVSSESATTHELLATPQAERPLVLDASKK